MGYKELLTKQAPPGNFLLVELEPDLHPKLAAVIFHVVAQMTGVASVSDLSLTPLEHLAERVLLRLSPADQRVWRKLTR